LHILAAVVVLVVLAGLANRRVMRHRPIVGAALLLVRSAAIAALALVLMGPSVLPRSERSTVKPSLTILLDRSQSMRTPDMRGRSRIAFALGRWLGEPTRQALSKRFDLRLLGFAADTQPMSPGLTGGAAEEIATGRATHLIGTVREQLLKRTPSLPSTDEARASAGIVVISDGHDSANVAARPVAKLARSRHLPIHTLTLGGPTEPRDLALIALPRQDYLMAGEGGELLTRVYHAGLNGYTANVRLHKADGSIITRQVKITGNDPRTEPFVEVVFPIEEDRPGLYEYDVTVDPAPGETEPANNTQRVYVHVTDQRIRVLLVEGEPYWDTKFLAQALRKDERIALVQITQVAIGRRERIVTRIGDDGEPSATAPNTLDEWSAYDVVILGRSIERLLDESMARLLPEYVSDRGGRLILARGRPYTSGDPRGLRFGEALSVIEPVYWGKGVVRDRVLALTPAGRSTALFKFELDSKAGDVSLERILARLPRLGAAPPADREKASAQVWARLSRPAGSNTTEGDPPAIVSMDYGRGKVLALAIDGLWRWRLLPPGERDLADIYNMFWSRVVRWMVMGGDFKPGEKVTMRLSRSSVRLGNSVVVEVVFKKAPPAGYHPVLRVLSPDGQTLQLPLESVKADSGAQPPTRFSATYAPRNVGAYEVRLELPDAGFPAEPLVDRFSVYDVNLERLHPSANPQLMRTLSEGSGGMVLQPEDYDDWPSLIERARRARLTPREPRYLWDHGLVLAGILCWLGLEWIVRRKAGLL